MILKRPLGPRRIRAADIGDGEVGLPAPDERMEELEAQLAAQRDAMTTMYKLLKSEKDKDTVDF